MQHESLKFEKKERKVFSEIFLKRCLFSFVFFLLSICIRLGRKYKNKKERILIARFNWIFQFLFFLFTQTI